MATPRKRPPAKPKAPAQSASSLDESGQPDGDPKAEGSAAWVAATASDRERPHPIPAVPGEKDEGTADWAERHAG